MKILKWLDDNLEEYIMIFLLVVISVVTMVQVIMRYFLKSAMPWPEELCRFAFVYSGLISAGYCIKNKCMLGVDALTSFLPKPVQTFLSIVGKVMLLVVFAYLLYCSIDLIKTTSTLSTAMQLSYKVVYASFPIGFGLGIIRQLQDFYHMFKKDGKEETK